MTQTASSRSNQITRWFIIATKSTKLIKAFKAVKLLKFAKPILTFGTMAISALVYSLFLGPWFSVGLVVMLFIHEMGHVWAMQMKGMPTSAPVFIPMLGAVIFSPPFKTREEEAFVGYGGPLIGSLAGLIMFGIWAITPGRPEILLLISFIAIYINLFNLLPLRPLDGGRITQVTGGWFKYIGIAVLLALTIAIRQPDILIIWILILSDMKMNSKLRAGIGVTCQTLMVVLMYLGYGTQTWWANFWDVTIASILNFMLVGSAIYDVNSDEVRNSLPQAPMEARVRWLVLYLLLIAVLIIVLYFQIPFLPEQIRNSGN